MEDQDAALHDGPSLFNRIKRAASWISQLGGLGLIKRTPDL
jgi:hypothetical protein